jgi:hypothetical protein
MARPNFVGLFAGTLLISLLLTEVAIAAIF